jgi:hypothetical protein
VDSALARVCSSGAGGPRPGLKLHADATFVSPDKTMRVEQYSRKQEDQSLLYQFWTFDSAHRHPFLLNPGESDELAGYQAGFRFSRNSRWLVRMQKLGAGIQTLFLYRRNGYQFSAATTKPLGDLAWDYFFTTPTSNGMHRNPQDLYALGHAFVGLVKGLEENYAGMGQHWPDSRYLVISLSFDMQGEEQKTPWIEAWHCVYEVETGTFSVPPDFAEHNAKAVRHPEPKSR